MQVLDATPAELDAFLADQSPTLLVLYLWGPGCPNCVVFKNHLPALMERLADKEVTLMKLDVYTYPEIARRYGVYGIPHFLLFKAGVRLGKMSEFRGDAFWLSVVNEQL